MFNLKVLNPFRKPTDIEIATRELEEARRQLLSHNSGLEYHGTMVDYYETKIVRLETYLQVEDAQRTRCMSR